MRLQQALPAALSGDTAALDDGLLHYRGLAEAPDFVLA
jgi:hypothetical protein